MRLLLSASTVLMVFSSTTSAAQGQPDGGISLSQTRVIFSSGDHAQVLGIKNSGQQRFLIQSRVLMASGDKPSAPFTVTPPLFTLQPDSRQQLRIVALGKTLPRDRESLFFLSILAIPSQQKTIVGTSKLSMGMRFGLKLFYRPVNLGTRPKVCSLQVEGQPDGVLIKNPTPFFQTFGHLRLNNVPVNLNIQASMLEPYGAQHYPMNGRGGQAEWQTIDDYGVLTQTCYQIFSSVEDKTL